MTETKLTVQLFLKSFIWLGLMAVVLFAAAGDWAWLAASCSACG
jgi:hypothetical protein